MIEERLSRLIGESLLASSSRLGLSGPPLEIELTKPKQKEFGDFSANIALVVAPLVERPPREVATVIMENLPAADFVERVEVAGPGFINFFISDDWLHNVLKEVAAKAADYGRAAPNGLSVQVEFLSANPTGPLHIGHARNASLGDALARVLEASGWRVERECYFNDIGGQIDRFGASVEARYLQVVGREAEVPEDGYHGGYVIDLAKEIAGDLGDALAVLPPEERFARLREEGVRRTIVGIQATLERFGIQFDAYKSERSLAESGEIAAAVERLRDAGYVDEREGAVWFRATVFGDDKDRPLIRSNGTHTYFAADCAYVIDKFSRGFDRVIYVLGADHHGDVKRLKGAAQALGYDPDAVEMIVYQFVAFLRGGEPMKMSRRAGTFVLLDELIDEVGADAARFTLLSHSNDSAMIFDIEEVKRQSMENPVYYVQYGHARIASILRRAAEGGVVLRPIGEVDLSVLTDEAELDLIRAIAEMPERLEQAAARRAPHRLTHYVQELAAKFHRFYTDCRVISDDEPLTQARLWLSSATKQTIANVLALLGVSAPESMERTDE